MKEIEVNVNGKENTAYAMLEPVAQIAKDTFGVRHVESIELVSYKPCDVSVEYTHGEPALIHMQYTFAVTPLDGEFDKITLQAI